MVASTNAGFNPNNLYTTQTWERFAKGQTLVGVNESDADFATVGKAGGHKKLQAHTHSIAHTHTPNTAGENFVTAEESQANNTRVTYASAGNRWVNGLTSQSHFHHRASTSASSASSSGSTGAGNGENMPPYITVYYWRRTK